MKIHKDIVRVTSNGSRPSYHNITAEAKRQE